MPSDAPIGQQRSDLENAVTPIPGRLAHEAPTPNWVERFTGAFRDEPAFAEVVVYGRAFRSAGLDSDERALQRWEDDGGLPAPEQPAGG